jgi:hypothetical protein
MNALLRARQAGGGALRQKYLADAQSHIARIDPTQHAELLQHLQAHVLAMGGRGDDTELAHVTPGEIVIPKPLQTPEFLKALYLGARALGIDPVRLVVGSGENVINPRTGQPEFDESNQDGTDQTNPPPANNDNFPRADACIEAGHECVDSGVDPKQCLAAEQACSEAADVYRGAPPNVGYVGIFPHGRTVYIPGGGKPPYLGPIKSKNR